MNKQLDILVLLVDKRIESVECYDNDQGYTIIKSMVVDGVKIEFTSSNSEAAIWWAERGES